MLKHVPNTLAILRFILVPFIVVFMFQEKYVEASQVYFNFRQTIVNTINQSREKYPYNKIELFNDDMTSLAEKDDLEIKAKKMKEAVLAAKKDFKDEFGTEFDFTIKNSTM